MSSMRNCLIVPFSGLVIVLMTDLGCKKSESGASGQGQLSSQRPSQKPSPTLSGAEAQAKDLVSGFLKGETEQAELTKKLLPTFEQCKTAFVPEEMAAKICEPWKEAPRAPNAHLSPSAGQTEVLVASATTEDLRAWNERAQSFHAGYKRLAEHLRPGLTVFRFTFVEPGKTTGLTFDALFFVDGKWFFVPKPWRGLRRERHEDGKP